MVSVYYIFIIPCTLSVLGCSIFLYHYLKFKAIRLTFGIKYIAYLQLADFVMCSLGIVELFSGNFILCNILSASYDFLMLFQTYWVSALSNYLYKIIYLEKEKESISIKKPLILGVIISLSVPVLELSNMCFKQKGDFCLLECEIDEINLVIDFINLSVLIISSFWSIYYSYKTIRKIKGMLQECLNQQKWTITRLTIYPYITFFCSFPSFIYYITQRNAIGTNFAIFCYSLPYFIGFFNSIILGISPEIMHAIRIENDIQNQSRLPLVNFSPS